jgi:hypothetical protein
MTESPLKNLCDKKSAFVPQNASSCPHLYSMRRNNRNFILYDSIVCALARKDSEQNQSLHLADKPVLVHWSSLFTVCQSRSLCPHLLHIFQYHVAMSVKCLNARKQLAIVATRNQDLVCVADGRLEDRERAAAEFVLFESRNFIFALHYIS